MASISRLKPGQIVYDVRSKKPGDYYQVEIIDVGLDSVLASWNSNKPRRYYAQDLRRWRVSRPK
jgi:hypothetical protein